jgi:hypothetical protein
LVLADEVVQITIIRPDIKDVIKENIAVASAVYSLFEITSMLIMRYNYFTIISVLSILVLIFISFDRFIPLFALPSKPDVRLIKHKEIENNRE